MALDKSNLKSIKEETEKAVHSDEMDQKAHALTKAFDLFSKESERLETAYTEIQRDLSKASQALEESNMRLNRKVRELDITTHYLKNILTNMSQGLLFINLAGIVTTYNRAAEQMLELEAMEVLFQPFSVSFEDTLFGFSMKKVLTERSLPEHFPLLSIQREHGETRYFEVEAKHVPSEEYMNHEPNLSRDATLDYTQGLIVLLRDVTEVTVLKRLADRNDRLKVLGEMAALVAHEIRNPLGGIKGFASLLVKDLEKDHPEQSEMAKYIIDGTESLNKLVTNVLNYTRPIEPQFELIDIIQLLKDTIQAITHDTTLMKKIKIETHLSPPTCEFYIDRQLFKSCLLNLFVNAVQSMSDEGIVKVSSRYHDNTFFVSIEDSGKGISEDDLPNIFSPFFTTKEDGTGVGLSEALKVAQAHDGTIEVESEVGKGTTFTITLPRSIHYPPNQLN